MSDHLIDRKPLIEERVRQQLEALGPDLADPYIEPVHHPKVERQEEREEEQADEGADEEVEDGAEGDAVRDGAEQGAQEDVAQPINEAPPAVGEVEVFADRGYEQQHIMMQQQHQFYPNWQLPFAPQGFVAQQMAQGPYFAAPMGPMDPVDVDIMEGVQRLRTYDRTIAIMEMQLEEQKRKRRIAELQKLIDEEAECTALLLSGVPHSDQLQPSASASPAVQDTQRSTPSTSSEGRQSAGQPAVADTPRRGRPRRTNAPSPDARETPKKRGRPRLSAANDEPPKKRGRPSKK